MGGGRHRSDGAATRALVVVTAAAVVRLIFAALLPVFPDEAYYWEWSRRLASGYFDHPPVVALLIRFGTTLFGSTAVGIRFGSILAGWIASVATVATARRLADDKAALRAAILISVLPLAAAGLVLATPDSALLAATAVTLYCVVRALEPASDAFRWWIAAGIALGAAFLSKYTAVLLPLGVLVAFASRPSLRERLRSPGPYVACVVAALMFLPVILWNAGHDWTSFAFQLKHGLGAPQGSALVAAWKHEGDLFGGQAGLVSPILFVLLGIVVWQVLRRPDSDAERVLGVVAALTFLFFVYSAIRQRAEPNWPAPAYIPALVLLAVRRRTEPDGWLRAGVGLAAVLSVVIYVQGLAPILPLKPARDPIARAFGWSELARVADSTQTALARGSTTSRVWLAADRYQEASELALLTPGSPTTFATNLAGRTNQYDLWPRFPDLARRGDALVLVVDESDTPHAAIVRLAPSFDSTARGALVVLRRGSGEIGRRRVWTLFGWRGTWPAVD